MQCHQQQQHLSMLPNHQGITVLLSPNHKTPPTSNMVEKLNDEDHLLQQQGEEDIIFVDEMELARIQRWCPDLPLLIVISDDDCDDDEYSVITTAVGDFGSGGCCSSIDGGSGVGNNSGTRYNSSIDFNDLQSETTSITSYSLGSCPLNDIMLVTSSTRGAAGNAATIKDTIPMMPRRQHSRSTLRSLSSSSSFGSKRKSRKPIRRERPTKKKQEMMIPLPTKDPTSTPTPTTNDSSTTIDASFSPPLAPPPPSTPPPSFVNTHNKEDKSLLKSPDTCKTVTTVAMTASTTSSLLVPSIDSYVTAAVSCSLPPRQRSQASDSSGYFFNPKTTGVGEQRTRNRRDHTGGLA